MIDVDNLSVGYGRTLVVEHLSFKIRTGECIGFLGRSGCGKTTVLHALAGLLPLEPGSEVIIGGRSSGLGSVRGIVFQEVILLGWRTVIENVCFPGRRIDVRAHRAEAEELLSILGLSDELDKYPHELSTGMRRRVEFARALLLDNLYLVADEPFSALDEWTRQVVWKWFREFRSKLERTTVLSTHSPEEALFLCDAVIVLSHKRPARAARHISIPHKWTLDQILLREDKEMRRLFAEISDSLSEASTD